MPKRSITTGGEGGEGLCGRRTKARDAFPPPRDPPEGRVARMSARGRRSARREVAPRVEQQVLDGSPATPTKQNRVSTTPTQGKRTENIKGSSTLPVGFVSERPTSSCTSPKVSKDWIIDTIMFRKDYEHAGKIIREEAWYACANIQGGVESYYRISPTSFTISHINTRARSFPKKLVIPQTKSFPRSVVIPSIRITRSGVHNMRSVVMGEAVRSFCRKYPGVAVILGGPGERDVNPEIVPFFDHKNTCVVACSSQYDCTQAACINGATILRGYEGFEKAVKAFSKETARLTSVGQIGPIVTRMGLGLELRKPKHLITIMNKKRYDDAFNIIAGFSGGLWLVRLVHHRTSRVDHCVLVDSFWTQKSSTRSRLLLRL